MAKVKGFGQAEILSSLDYQKIYSSSNNPTYQLILSILRYTGERIGATLKLEVMDVYENPYRTIPRTVLVFPSSIRKQAPKGKTLTREVPVSRNLAAELQKYTPPHYGLLFPSPKNPDKPLTVRAFDDWLRRTCNKAGLGRRGISTHSPRRTFITSLSEKGVPIRTIQSLTGHRSLSVLQQYVEVSEDSRRSAIELL